MQILSSSQCIRGRVCIVRQCSLLSLNTAGDKEIESLGLLCNPRDRMFPPFDVQKNPPEQDNKVALTWKFPAVQVLFIK